MSAAQKVDRLIRMPEFKARVGLGRSAIYMKIKDGSLPKPVSLGGGSIAWRESEVDAWMEALPYANENDVASETGDTNPN